MDVRLLLHDEVMKLRADSLSYHQIISRIEEKYHVTLPKGTISGWVNGRNTPFNAGHNFTPRPIPALAYVIGAKRGDASLNVKTNTYQYRIRLQAVDREFVEIFNEAVATILDCPKHRLWKGDTARETHVEYGSFLLYRFLQRPLKELITFIEHDLLCVAAFLKGFFDSEGSVDIGGSTTASNSNLETLHYVQYLLKRYFGIETTGPHTGTVEGSILTRRGKSYRRNVTCYYIYIRRKSLRRFHEQIGMTISRKAARVAGLLETHGI